MDCCFGKKRKEKNKSGTSNETEQSQPQSQPASEAQSAAPTPTPLLTPLSHPLPVPVNPSQPPTLDKPPSFAPPPPALVNPSQPAKLDEPPSLAPLPPPPVMASETPYQLLTVQPPPPAQPPPLVKTSEPPVHSPIPVKTPPQVPVKPSEPPVHSPMPVETPPQVPIKPSETALQPPLFEALPSIHTPPPDQTPSPAQPPPIEPASAQIPPPTVENCISLFQTFSNAGDVDYLIDLINKLLEYLQDRSKEEKTLTRSTSSETLSDTLNCRTNSLWTSFLLSGSLFLEFVNKHIQLEKGDEGNKQVVVQILQSVGKVHWVVGGLAVVAFLLDQTGQISENRIECIELLRQMAKIGGHIRKLKYDIPQEEKILSEAITLIVEGSMMCASQLKSRALFRFLKASVDSKRLASLQSKINQLYQDLTLRVAIKIHHQQPVAFLSWQPIYPDYAVGIEEQKKQVMALLDMEPRNKSTLAVVIYGFGGIGKTTLATAVIADLDLTDYNYSGVQIQEDRSRNDIKCMQQQILKDAFPAYTYDRNITLRNSAEGRDHLTSAFQLQGNKPVFLFIDNALRAEELQELFPKRLSGLPKRSRIVVTTRNLGVTDMLIDAGLARCEHRVGTLPEQEAIKILLRDGLHNTIDIETDSFRKALQICDGIPLVLQIVGARLRKQNYQIERCTQIFEALETGEDIKGENLSQRLVNFVYSELESSTREAFLDICCFFANWSRRDVEYIVGTEDVTLLHEAALMKTSDKNELIVHDIIRAKGRSMCQGNRIMDVQSWLEVAHDDQKLKQIKGVWLGKEKSEFGHEVDEKQLHSLKNSVRVLGLESQIKVSGSSQRPSKFKELRFLRLGGDISALWPPNLESLEQLTVFHGPVFKNGVTLYQLPKKLRLMRAAAQSPCEESILTKIIPNSSLEELDLKELKGLQKLPEKLDHLTGLKVLILDEWDKIEELPEQVCGLRSLCKLSICCGNSLRNLPKSFGQLSSLEELILKSCMELEELPSTFGDLSSLKLLNLAECINLKELPFSFGKLSSLEVLNLDGCCKLETFPPSFWELGSLTELSCSSLELKELPSNFGDLSSLKHLNLTECIKLKQLPFSFGKLRSLEVLNLDGCCKLEIFPPSFWELSSLTELSCSSLELKELPPSIEKLSSLRHLDLSYCVKLKSLPSTIGKLESLNVLNLFACKKLEEVPSNIGELPSMRKIDLRGCRKLRAFPAPSLTRKTQGPTIFMPDHLIQ